MSGDPAEVKEFEAIDKTWKLFFNNRALRAVEERNNGRSILEVIDRIKASSVHAVTTTLAAGLMENHRDATIYTADKIIDDLGLAAVIEIIGPALTDSRPFAERSGEK